MTDKMKMREQESTHANMPAGEKKKIDADMLSDVQISKRESMTDNNTSIQQQVSTSANQSASQSTNQQSNTDSNLSINIPDLGLSSALGILTPEPNPTL